MHIQLLQAVYGFVQNSDMRFHAHGDARGVGPDNPAADDGYGVITWPGGNGYLKLTLYGDVTRSA